MAIIVASFIGYEKVEKRLERNTPFDQLIIILEEDNSSLNEVVVQAGSFDFDPLVFENFDEDDRRSS